MLNPNELRKRMLSLRREFAKTGDYASACENICRNLTRLTEFKAAKNVMLYLPLGGEADVTSIAAGDKRFFVPITEGVVITPALFRPEMKLKKGEYGVLEPEEPIFADKYSLDFVIVPAVALDAHKNRMGFGKGCYDRFLADMKCTKAAVGFEFQLVPELAEKPHDVAMDYIITEGGII